MTEIMTLAQLHGIRSIVISVHDSLPPIVTLYVEDHAWLNQQWYGWSLGRTSSLSEEHYPILQEWAAAGYPMPNKKSWLITPGSVI